MGGKLTVMSPPEIICSVPITLNKNRVETKGMGLKMGDKKSHVSVQRDWRNFMLSLESRYEGMYERDTVQSGRSFYTLS